MGVRDTEQTYLAEINESNRWHARLGHVNLTTMKAMIQKELVTGVPNINVISEVCSSCMLGKQARHSFPQSTTYRATKTLQLVHGDLCGPITPSTAGGSRYISVIIDDYSRYMWTILLKEKSEAFHKFKKLREVVEKETGEKIITFRTDRGGEFFSKEFNEYCELAGIKRHLTAPYTPQQNGVVERKNRTLMEMTRSMLKHMHMPNYMWGEAIRHATYLINRITTRALQDMNPYEVFRGKKPNITHLHIFGCIGYARIVKPQLRKLDDRSRILVHLGTEPGSKAYRMLNPENRRILVSRDVVFDETKGWNWSEDGKELKEDFVVDLGEFGNHGVQELSKEIGSRQDEKKSETEHQIQSETEHGKQSTVEAKPTELHVPVTVDGVMELRRSERQSVKPKYLEDYVMVVEEEGELLLLNLNNEPISFNEASEREEWIAACKDEITSIEKNIVWDLVDLPYGIKPIGLRWIFKIKRNSDGSINKFKARLVAKGYVQQYGIDFEEVFAPVARLETVRLLVGMAAARGWGVHHLDVKTSFLHGELKETVYVTRLEGFEVKGSEKKVYKLNKALYGLRQAPRACNHKLNQILLELGFRKCSKEPSVYRKNVSTHLLVIAVYVDDLFVTGSKMSSKNLRPRWRLSSI